MKRQIEVFTANCPVCDPVVQLVKDLSCNSCEIITYDLVKQCEDKTCLSKIKEYNVKSLPAVAVNGKLMECCENSSITKENLIAAGIGQ